MSTAASRRLHQWAAWCLTAFVTNVAAAVSADEPEGTFSVPVSPGWNLLSLPANVGNGSRASLFPSAVSPAYVFEYPAGYVSRDTLQCGIGFWLKFPSADTAIIQGDVVFRDTIEVRQGWNLIGSLSVPLPVDSVETEPPGIITSQFFRYGWGGYWTDTLPLQPGLGYWVKVNQAGSMILSSGSGLPCPGAPTVFYAGKTYNTVQIGSQCWLRENLDVGTMIQGSQDQTDNGIIEKYCYNNDTSHCATYGGLYQWRETMQYGTTHAAQGICPPGWHMPARPELEMLGSTVAGDGNALKAVGQGIGAGAGTNTSGFSELLAGDRITPQGGFGALGLYAFVWSSTQYDSSFAFYQNLVNINAAINVFSGIKDYGLSVRCVKD